MPIYATATHDAPAITGQSAPVNGLLLPVMEHFYTLQGEGAFAGTPAYFIRLGGCDVGCHWCDVKESWPIDTHPILSVAELVTLVQASGAPLAVVTGGEPTMHNLRALTDNLRASGIRTHIETSGAHPLTGDWDWITLSPKKFAPALTAYFEVCHELKVVVFHESDVAWAGQLSSQTHSAALRYLQPEWSRRERITPLLISHCLAHPKWRLSLQTHKYIDIP